MKQICGILALLGTFIASGALVAQTPPPAVVAQPAVAQPAATQPATAVPPSLQMREILGPLLTGETVLGPEPASLSCPPAQCRRQCGCGPGCLTMCDFSDCSCSCICG
jgi:hypothetical protein